MSYPKVPLLLGGPLALGALQVLEHFRALEVLEVLELRGRAPCPWLRQRERSARSGTPGPGPKAATPAGQRFGCLGLLGDGCWCCVGRVRSLSARESLSA